MHWINADINPYFFAGFFRLAERNGVAHRVSAIYADVEALPFRDNYADVIVSRGSYPFWPDLRRGLAEILRVLKPGGAAYGGRGFSKNLSLTVAREVRKKQGGKMDYDVQEHARRFRRILDELGVKRYRIILPSVEAGYEVNYGVWAVFWKTRDL
jgi:ubiquinone/menaquinone biosynthesis C-methylase UbiE